MLDLNCPEDAKAYVMTWVDQGEVVPGDEETVLKLESGSPEEFLLVAKQLFLYCDSREAPGGLQ